MPARPVAADPGAESEKLTLNMGPVDLGRIDLLVREGFYGNRSDFIRQAIRARLDRHDGELRRAADRLEVEIGVRRYGREELEARRDAGRPLAVRVLGLASIAHDVTPELAREAIASLTVLGTLQASPEVRRALADRIR